MMKKAVKIFKKSTALIMILVLSTLSIMGCAGSTSPTNVNESGTTKSESTKTSESEGSNFNATGFPIVTEMVTKNFMIRKPPHIGDPNDMVTLQEYEKLSNVKINWDVVSSDGFTERVNLVMASNKMPDAIVKGVPDITKTSADGSIVDLSQLIDQYSVGIKNLYQEYPEVKAASESPDGKQYSLPTINTLEPNRTGHRNLWINQKWLTNLNLQIPKTLDDFVEVLKAFRDGDPNGNGVQDEIPYVVEFSGGDHLARVDNFAASWGLYPNMGYQLQIKDDKVSIYVTSEKYKEVLQFMNMLWNEKLLDNSLYTQTSDVALSKFSSEVAGSFGLSSDDLWNKYSEDYAPLVPPTNDKGDTPVIGLGSVYGGAAFVITKADQTPEISLRWIDYFYTEDGAKLIGALSPELEGITAKKSSDGGYDYSDTILNDERGVSVAVGEVCPLPGGGFPYWRNADNSDFIYSNTVKTAVPTYESYYQKDSAYAYPVFTTEEAEQVNTIRMDLDVYLKECEAKFVTGELSFDKWDEYVSACEDMRINDLEQYFQTAYDRIK